MRRLTKILLIPVSILLLMQSCYDDYFQDFEYSAVYFAVQDPLRTVIIEDGKELKVEIGAVLGGKYSNEADEKVQFTIAPELLNDYPQLKLLPAEYYQLSNNSEIVIPKGSFLGTIDLTLNENFIADKDAHDLYYALPVEITSTSADSVLAGKEHTIIAIKYQNKYYGSYWIKGIDHTLNEANEIVSSYRYSNADLVTNNYTIFSTMAVDSSIVSYVGLDISGNNSMKLAINNEGNVTISSAASTDISMIDGTGNYMGSEKQFYLDYSYMKGAEKHQVKDTLYYFDTPVKLETWMGLIDGSSE